MSLYTIDYDIADSSGNAATTVTRTVNVVDTTKPVINLSGNSSTTIESGLTYIDSGATISDNYDSGLSYNVDLSVVDTSTLGTYTSVSYTHLRAHETRHDLVCRLLLEKKK